MVNRTNSSWVDSIHQSDWLICNNISRQIPSKPNVPNAVATKQKTDIDLHIIIDDICDHLLDDIVLPWYKEVSSEQITLGQTFK